jgi:hypothetical protein
MISNYRVNSAEKSPKHLKLWENRWQLEARAVLQIIVRYPAKVEQRIKVSERGADDPPVSGALPLLEGKRV